MPPKKPRARLADIEAADEPEAIEFSAAAPPAPAPEDPQKVLRREQQRAYRARTRLTQAKALEMAVERLEAMHSATAEIARALPKARAAAEEEPANVGAKPAPSGVSMEELQALRDEFEEKLKQEKNKRKLLKHATRYIAKRAGVRGDEEEQPEAEPLRSPRISPPAASSASVSPARVASPTRPIKSAVTTRRR